MGVTKVHLQEMAEYLLDQLAITEEVNSKSIQYDGLHTILFQDDQANTVRLFMPGRNSAVHTKVNDFETVQQTARNKSEYVGFVFYKTNDARNDDVFFQKLKHNGKDRVNKSLKKYKNEINDVIHLRELEMLARIYQGSELMYFQPAPNDLLNEALPGHLETYKLEGMQSDYRHLTLGDWNKYFHAQEGTLLETVLPHEVHPKKQGMGFEIQLSNTPFKTVLLRQKLFSEPEIVQTSMTTRKEDAVLAGLTGVPMVDYEDTHLRSNGKRR